MNKKILLLVVAILLAAITGACLYLNFQAGQDEPASIPAAGEAEKKIEDQPVQNSDKESTSIDLVRPPFLDE